MRKRLPLFFLCVIALGIAQIANAAPLAQVRDVLGTVKRGSEVTRVQAHGENRLTSLSPGVRRLKNSATTKFNLPTSLVKERNSKALRSATTAQRASSTLSVYGTVIFNSTWTSKENIGVYKLPVSAGGVLTPQFLTTEPVYSFYDGDGKVYSMHKVAYGSYVIGYDLYVYDAETGINLDIVEFDDIPLLATDVAFDPVSGRIYGCFSGEYYGEVYRHWGYLDIESRSVVKIADLGLSYRGVAIDKLGQAYGIDLSGNLYKIDKTTGVSQFVGETGCPSLYYMSSAAYNDKDNTIILAYCNEEASGLVEIDPTTAESSILADFVNEEEVIGMYIPFQAPDKAPDAPGLEVSCTEGSMDADFTITLPTELYDGTDATDSQFGYKIYADGVEILTGTGSSGDIIHVSKTMEHSGEIMFAAVATNADGESNQTKYSCYIGKGTPSAPGNVTLTYSDGNLILSWSAVTISSDGGYINSADVKYEILDAEGVTIESSVEGETWTIAQAIPDNYTGYKFGVIAKYDTKVSKSVFSNLVYLGHYNAPFKMDLKDQSNLGQHKVIDVNNDGKTWLYKSNCTVYSYSNSNNADDWLITPAIYLEAGKAYDFEAVAHAYSDKYPEKLEIKMGMAATVEGMTQMLVETTTLGGADVTLKAPLVPAVSGEYYIGFHAVSDAGQWSLYLPSYFVSEPYGASAPDMVTDLKAIPDQKGDLKASIEFKTSAKTVLATDYTGEMLVKVFRGDVLIEEKSVSANTLVTVTDEVEMPGYYTYIVESYTPSGEKGRATSVTTFVGPNVPLPPSSVKAVENPNRCGELTVTWLPPVVDIDGNPLYEDNLTYNVYLYSYDEKAWVKQNEQPLNDLTFTFQAQSETAPQQFVQIGLETLNRGVESENLSGAGLIPVGPAYSLPVAMSCVDDLSNYIVGIDDREGCEFGMKEDGEMSSVTSQDGDGQFFYGERVGSSPTLGMGKGCGDFILGKISLEGVNHPVFSFYTWKITETDKTKLDIIAVCEGEQYVVTTIDYTNDTDNIWTKQIVNLEAYVGKSIQLIIRYYSDGLVYCFFDNMKIIDMPDYDLGAVSVTAPKSVAAGEPFDVTVVVENVGRLDVGHFTVELLANGEVVAEQAVDALIAGEETALTFEQTLSMAGARNIAYTAYVVYDADNDLSNNLTSQAAIVEREASLLPQVQSLEGEYVEEGVSLTWDAILHDELPYDPIIESFENAEPFAKSYDGWTFIDRDNAPSGNLGNIEVPNHQGEVEAESFIVIDGTHENFVNSGYGKEYLASSGNQYLGSIYSLDNSLSQLVASDDWAISPLLKGCAQTVTFKGKNCSINYSEYIQVWFTTEDSVNPDDFVQLNSFNSSGVSFRVVRTDGWGDFSFDLPDGALRFAIRVVSDDGMMFMLDDVLYLAAEATIGLELIGYNVYRDGQALTTEPIMVNSYLDSDVDKSVDHIYHVTAIYNRGESEATALTLQQSKLQDITLSGARISVEGNSISVTETAGKPVVITSTDGKTIFSGEGDTHIDVNPAVYLVSVGTTTTTKVVVR